VQVSTWKRTWAESHIAARATLAGVGVWGMSLQEISDMAKIAQFDHTRPDLGVPLDVSLEAEYGANHEDD